MAAHAGAASACVRSGRLQRPIERIKLVCAGSRGQRLSFTSPQPPKVEDEAGIPFAQPGCVCVPRADAVQASDCAQRKI
eukprot:CAMPEP_0204610908 /NCGR_PEP_ID=MMETSP0661-20131031/61748_1 /ASSEMBLY_ACC=CAM_ASM_000606 /TAXON_ID=109239 /ORGANISM="Alexandrium margalefi, Strain AMGDE01CS-322" /LENGTH=78 /DNA_ID=CAMNT_0051622735 /DNA_START=10 /DNA_END=246 /DNA_ORIENTATION=-